MVLKIAHLKQEAFIAASALVQTKCFWFALCCFLTSKFLPTGRKLQMSHWAESSQHQLTSSRMEAKKIPILQMKKVRFKFILPWAKHLIQAPTTRQALSLGTERWGDESQMLCEHRRGGWLIHSFIQQIFIKDSALARCWRWALNILDLVRFHETYFQIWWDVVVCTEISCGDLKLLVLSQVSCIWMEGIQELCFPKILLILLCRQGWDPSPHPTPKTDKKQAIVTSNHGKYNERKL